MKRISGPIPIFFLQVAKMSIQTAVASEYTHMVLCEIVGGKTAKESFGVKEVCIHDLTRYFNIYSYLCHKICWTFLWALPVKVLMLANLPPLLYFIPCEFEVNHLVKKIQFWDYCWKKEDYLYSDQMISDVDYRCISWTNNLSIFTHRLV